MKCINHIYTINKYEKDIETGISTFTVILSFTIYVLNL